MVTVVEELVIKARPPVRNWMGREGGRQFWDSPKHYYVQPASPFLACALRHSLIGSNCSIQHMRERERERERERLFI